MHRIVPCPLFLPQAGHVCSSSFRFLASLVASEALGVSAAFAGEGSFAIDCVSGCADESLELVFGIVNCLPHPPQEACLPMYLAATARMAPQVHLSFRVADTTPPLLGDINYSDFDAGQVVNGGRRLGYNVHQNSIQRSQLVSP